MSLRVATANLLKKFRFSASQALRASRVTTNALPISFSGKLNLSHRYQTGEYSWRVNLRDPCPWFVISGYVVTLGISANTVFAEDVTTEASFSNNPGDNSIGLRKIEDGSVVSNIHTAKWRIFTDKAREFFLQGKLDDAERLFLSAIQEAKEGFGKQDPHVASACNNLVILPALDNCFFLNCYENYTINPGDFSFGDRYFSIIFFIQKFYRREKWKNTTRGQCYLLLENTKKKESKRVL